MRSSEEVAIRRALDAVGDAFLDALAAQSEATRNAPDRLFSIEEARQRLGGISRATLYAEMSAGRLESIKIRRRRFISSSAISAYARDEPET